MIIYDDKEKMDNKTVIPSSGCIICGSKKVHYNFSLGKYRVEECAECGLMQLNPQPTDRELSEIYSLDYFAFSCDEKGQAHASALKSATSEHYLNLLTEYSGGHLQGKLLEIGCGSGDFLVCAAARGLAVTGLEFSPHAADVAGKKLGSHGRVICGETDKILSEGEKFDYIVFADVLEHVRNPRQFLRDVHLMLNPQGTVVSVVPSLDSFSAWIMKNRWIEFKPEHLWYFSRRTLSQILYTEGYGTIKILPAKKRLSFDYVAEIFERNPVKPFITGIRFFRRVLPGFVKRCSFPIVASGIIGFSRKMKAIKPQVLSVILPVYNEKNTVRTVIESVLNKTVTGLRIELVIVESGSVDGTQDIVSEYDGREGVKIIRQEKPLGKGNAVQAGLAQISGDLVLIQDADDEYDIEDYDALIEPLLSGNCAFVLGARHGGRVWKMRKFDDQRLTGHVMNLGHWIFTLLINVFFGLRLKDPFTMYKVFRADCLDGLKFDANRFDFDFELLIKLVRSGYKPVEIPVNYRSRSFKEGKKIRVFRDPLTWIRAIFKYRFQKLHNG